jgi:hypothetical protein
VKNFTLFDNGRAASNASMVCFVIVADNGPSIGLRHSGTTCEDRPPVLVWIHGVGLNARSSADP